MSFLKNALTDFNKEPSAYSGIGEPIKNTDLPRDVETVIVGGGLAGLSCAIELAQNGREVVVLEARSVGDGASGRSGGQLWPGYNKSFSEMVDGFGTDTALRVWKMTHEALRKVHQRLALRADKCDFRKGVLLTSKTQGQADWIESEAKTLMKAGLDFVTFLSGDEIRKSYVNTHYYLNGMLFEGDEDGAQYGHLNPLKYTQSMAMLAVQKGVKLIAQNPVTGFSVRDDGRYVLSTPKGEVSAKNVVMATGVDLSRPKGMKYVTLPNTHVSVGTVILATEAMPEKLAREMVIGQACFCDAADAAMNYGRLIEELDRQGYYRLTLGGADALGQAQTAFDILNIEREMRKMFPLLDREGVRIEKIWGGSCDLTRSGLPYIINPRDGFYAIGGFSGQGMVNSTLYGEAVAQVIMGDARKFEILKQMNPKFYASSDALAGWMNGILAWGQAAVTLLPMALRAKVEGR